MSNTYSYSDLQSRIVIKVKEFLNRNDVDETTRISVLDLDDLDKIELLLDLEDEFLIDPTNFGFIETFSDDIIDEAETVGDIIDGIANTLKVSKATDVMAVNTTNVPPTPAPVPASAPTPVPAPVTTNASTSQTTYKVVKLDKRGRLGIPASLVKQLGLKPGNNAYLASSKDKGLLIISPTPYDCHVQVGSLKVSSDYNIRVTSNLLRTVKYVGTSFKVRGDNVHIVVEK